jgi:orotidine-5'-phosphate decarboxylase
VARLAQGPWNLNGQLGLVVGATYPAEIERVRAWRPTLPLLIPGVGAQGGDAWPRCAPALAHTGHRPDHRELVARHPVRLAGDDFAAAARREALRTRDLLQAARA